jgi:hypothetical protein
MQSSRVGVNCSKFDCSTIICLTLLAGNQLLDTKFINCSNPVNACLTGFEQMIKIFSIARIQFKIAVDHYLLIINFQKMLEFSPVDIIYLKYWKLCRAKKCRVVLNGFKYIRNLLEY